MEKITLRGRAIFCFWFQKMIVHAVNKLYLLKELNISNAGIKDFEKLSVENILQKIEENKRLEEYFKIVIQGIEGNLLVEEKGIQADDSGKSGISQKILNFVFDGRNVFSHKIEEDEIFKVVSEMKKIKKGEETKVFKRFMYIALLTVNSLKDLEECGKSKELCSELVYFNDLEEGKVLLESWFLGEDLDGRKEKIRRKVIDDMENKSDIIAGGFKLQKLYLESSSEYLRYIDYFYGNTLVEKVYRYVDLKRREKRTTEVREFDMILNIIKKGIEKYSDNYKKSSYLEELLMKNKKIDLKRNKGNISLNVEGREVVLSYRVLLGIAYIINRLGKSKSYTIKEEKLEKGIFDYIIMNLSKEKPRKRNKNQEEIRKSRINYIQEKKEMLIKGEMTFSKLKEDSVENLNRYLIYKIEEKESDYNKNHKLYINRLMGAKTVDDFENNLIEIYGMYNIEIPKKCLVEERERYKEYLEKVNLYFIGEVEKRKDNLKFIDTFLRVSKRENIVKEHIKIGVKGKYVRKLANELIWEGRVNEDRAKILKGVGKIIENKRSKGRDNKEQRKLSDIELIKMGHKEIREKLKVKNKNRDLFKLCENEKDMKNIVMTEDKLEVEEVVLIGLVKDIVFDKKGEKRKDKIVSYKNLLEIPLIEREKRLSQVRNYISQLDYLISLEEWKEWLKYIEGNRNEKYTLEEEEIRREREFKVNEEHIKIGSSKEYIDTIEIMLSKYEDNKKNLEEKKKLKDYRNKIFHFKKGDIVKIKARDMAEVLRELNDSEIEYYRKRERVKNLLKYKVEKKEK